MENKDLVIEKKTGLEGRENETLSDKTLSKNKCEKNWLEKLKSLKPDQGSLKEVKILGWILGLVFIILLSASRKG